MPHSQGGCTCFRNVPAHEYVTLVSVQWNTEPQGQVAGAGEGDTSHTHIITSRLLCTVLHTGLLVSHHCWTVRWWSHSYHNDACRLHCLPGHRYFSAINEVAPLMWHDTVARPQGGPNCIVGWRAQGIEKLLVVRVILLRTLVLSALLLCRLDVDCRRWPDFLIWRGRWDVTIGVWFQSANVDYIATSLVVPVIFRRLSDEAVPMKGMKKLCCAASLPDRHPHVSKVTGHWLLVRRVRS